MRAADSVLVQALKLARIMTGRPASTVTGGAGPSGEVQSILFAGAASRRALRQEDDLPEPPQFESAKSVSRGATMLLSLGQYSPLKKEGEKWISYMELLILFIPIDDRRRSFIA